MQTLLKDEDLLADIGCFRLEPILQNREVDYFIEKLDSTIKFFTGLESSSDEGNGDDDFVPFI